MAESGKQFSEKVNMVRDKLYDLVPSSSGTISVASRGEIRGGIAEIVTLAHILCGMVINMEELLEKANRKVAEFGGQRGEGEAASSGTPRAASTTTAKTTKAAPETYASKLKNNEIIVRSSTNQKSEEVRKELKQKVDPVEHGIGIAKLQLLPNGAIKINCAEKADLDKLKEKIQEETSLRVRDKKFRKPTMVMKNVRKGDEEKEIARVLHTQNEWIREAFGDVDQVQKEMKVVRFFSHKGNEEKKSVLFEVSKKARGLLLTHPVKYAYECGHLEDFLEPLRCYNCQLYGHKSADCKEKEAVCGWCAKAGHTKRDCKQRHPSCAACIQVNRKIQDTQDKMATSHPSGAKRGCVVLRNLEQRIRSETNYGE